MLKAPMPTRGARAVVGWFAGAFAFECFLALSRGSYSVAGISGLLAVVAALVSLNPELTPYPQLIASLNRLSADARWWAAIGILSLAAVALSPWAKSDRISPAAKSAIAAVHQQVANLELAIGSIEHGSGNSPGLGGLEAKINALNAEVKSLSVSLSTVAKSAAQASGYHEHAAQKLLLQGDLNQLDMLFEDYKDISVQILTILKACPPRLQTADVHHCRTLSGLSAPYHRTVAAMTDLISRDFGKPNVLSACGADLWPLVTDGASGEPDAAYRQHRTQIQCIERQISAIESAARAQIHADDAYINAFQQRSALGG